MKVLTDLKLAVPGLQAGQIGVIPTDTIYGLAAVASNQAAVGRLYELKKREHKPGTIIAADIDQLVALGIPRRYLTAVAHYWPNPISIEVPHNITYLNQMTGRQACRIPSNIKVQAMLQQTGPLVTSSANQPGEPPAETVKAAQAYFDDTVDFYLDGGDLSSHQPSTIIRVVDDIVEVVREGAIRINERGEIEP